MADQQAILEMLIEVGENTKRELADLRTKLTELSTAFKGEASEAVIAGLIDRVDQLSERLGVAQKQAATTNLTLEQVGKVRQEMEAVSGATSQVGRNVEALGTAAGQSTKAFGPLTEIITRARDAVTDFSEKATTGTDRIIPSAGEARKRIDELEAAIRAAAAAGRDLGEAPAELARLKNEYADATKAAGEYKVAQERAKVEIDASARAAGGFRSGLVSLQDILQAIDPRLVKLAGTLLAVKGVLLALDAAVGAINLGLGKLSDAAGPGEFSNTIEEMEGNLKRLISVSETIPAIFEGFEIGGRAAGRLWQSVSGEAARADQVVTASVENIRGALLQMGEDADGSLADVERRWGAFVERMNAVRERIRETTSHLRPDVEQETAWEDLARVIEHSLGIVEKTMPRTQLQVTLTKEKLEELRGAATELGSAVDPALVQRLDNMIAKLREVEESGDPFLEFINKLAEGIGQKGPTAIFDMLDALGRYEAGVSRGGKVTAEQADVIVKGLESARTAIRALPEEQQVAFAAYLRLLDQFETRYTKFSSEIRDTISGNLEELRTRTEATVAALNAELEKGPLTPEQKERYKGVIQDLLDEWRGYGEEVPVSLQGVATTFEATTTLIEKEAERQKKSVEGVIDAFARFAERIEDIRGRLDPKAKVVDDLAALEKELEALQSKGVLTGEEQARFEEVTQLVSDLRGQVQGLTFDFEQQGFQWAKTADDGIDRVKQQKDAFSDLVDSVAERFSGLNATQRAQAAQTLSHLEQLSSRSAATKEDFASALDSLSDLFRAAGQNTLELDQRVADLRGETLDYREVLDKSLQTARKLGEATDDLAGSVDSASGAMANQAERADVARKREEELTDQSEKLTAALERRAEVLRNYVVDVEAAIAVDREWLGVCRELVECHRALKAEMIVSEAAA